MPCWKQHTALSCPKQNRRRVPGSSRLPPASCTQERPCTVTLLICAATGADKVVLFELDPDERHLTVPAHYGVTPLHLDTLPEVIHSPVSDVAEEASVYCMALTGLATQATLAGDG